MTERLTRDARYVEVTDEYVPSGTDPRSPPRGNFFVGRQNTFPR